MFFLALFSLLSLTTALPSDNNNRTVSATDLNARPGSLVCDEPGSMRAKGPKKLDCVNALLGLKGQSIEAIEISKHEPHYSASGSCAISATIAPESRTGEDITNLLVIYVAGLSVITACDRPGGTGGKIEGGQLRIGDHGDVIVKIEKVEKVGGEQDGGDQGGNGTLTSIM